jgi:hypothetical protein
MSTDSRMLIDFKDPSTPPWRPINDGVMGGLSQSQMKVTEDGTGVFEGDLSLENNGGFASVRTSLEETDLSGFDGLAVRVAGDGNRYRLRLRIDNRFDGIAYQATFETTGSSGGKDAEQRWETIEIPFEAFAPTYRGRTPSNAPPLDIKKICQVGLMIADKQEGRFRLQVAWVRAIKMTAPDSD